MPAPLLLGIVTGLKFEAAIVPAHPRVRALCHGMGPERAARAARALLEAGATHLMSFGIAGGLMPGAGPGHTVMASRVVQPGAEIAPCDPDWMARLVAISQDISAVDTGPIACSAEVVATPADKVALGEATGARAVDMESHAVGLVAQAAGVPFAVIRVVADPYDQPMPPEVVAGFTWEGDIDTGAAARALLPKPWLIPTALRIGWHCDVAKRRLSALSKPLAARGFALV